MLGVLREPEPGVEHQQRGVHAGQHRGVHPRHQLGAHLAEHVLVPARAHPAAPRQCMSTHGTRAEATTAAMPGSASPAGHVVDQRRTRLDRRRSHRRAGGVDAHRHPGRDQVGDHRQHPRGLRLGVDPLRAGSGGLAADVDEIGARRPQLEAVPDGVVVVEEPAAVGERVGRDVEDAQHRAPPELRQHHAPRINDSASARELGELWKIPRTADVVVRAPGLRMPRIPMHRCSASITTITPRGSSLRTIASAT